MPSTGTAGRFGWRLILRSQATSRVLYGSVWAALPLLSVHLLADSPPPSPSNSAPKYEATAIKASREGRVEKAVQNWEKAADGFGSAGDRSGQRRVLTQLSQAYRVLGRYDNAIAATERIHWLSTQEGDPQQVALVLSQVADAHITAANAEKGSEHPPNYHLNKARDAYLETAKIADQVDHLSPVAAKAVIKAGLAALRAGAHLQAKQFLDQALQRTNLLGKPERWFGSITIAKAYCDLRPYHPDGSESLYNNAEQILVDVARSAEPEHDLRTASYALGYLGSLYERVAQREFDAAFDQEAMLAQALRASRRATFLAQRANSPESLYRWQWQIGRVLNARGQAEEAIKAYRQAIETLDDIRQDLIKTTFERGESFRDSVGTIYFELVDLLLRRSRGRTGALQQEDLEAARDVIERLKVAELRNYFGDDCTQVATPNPITLGEASRKAAVIYPIFLADRLELIVGIDGHLQAHPVEHPVKDVEQQIKALRFYLEKRTTNEYRPLAKQLYEWLIGAFEVRLERYNSSHPADEQIDTLVFIPDGPLHRIPIAALHDGEDFLIESYAVAVTPGLRLSDPQPFAATKKSRVLVAGLTEPVAPYAALPHVSTETRTIQENYHAPKPLLDRGFVLRRLERRLAADPYQIIHFASHAEFNDVAGQSFLLAFNEKLRVTQLDRFLGRYRLSPRNPLELLVLSACNTASGNETDGRASLGLAGVAVKAGAKSALATLWHINDNASAQLVGHFYKNLGRPGLTKARALQMAQQEMLKHRWYKHPGYWAPFLLINNWL